VAEIGRGAAGKFGTALADLKVIAAPSAEEVVITQASAAARPRRLLSSAGPVNHVPTILTLDVTDI
jgi:hypothetical protein